MSDILEKLKGNIIISVQAMPSEPLYDEVCINAMIKSVITGGAKGLRVAGARDVRNAKKISDVPVIGITKPEKIPANYKELVYITPSVKDADALIEAGADIIAFDATPRDRGCGENISQIIDFIENFPKYIENLDNSLMAIPFFKAMHISLDTSEVMSSFAASSTEMINSIVDFVKSASSAFLYIFTSVVFMFFFLADKDIISKGFLKFFPVEIRQKAGDIINTILEKLGGYVVAQFIVSASVWIVMTIGLLIFHINYALILGLIAGVLSIIPVLGSALSLIICLIATYESGIWALIIVTVMFTLSHFVENNVVRPWVYSKFLNLHPIIIFLALFVGAKYAGVVGVIFAPPMAMALCILIDELYEYHGVDEYE